MKKIKYFIFMLLISIIGMGSVSANTIYSIDVDLKLDSNGNGKVTEIWKANVDSKTELYKPMGDLGNSKITNFKVSMDGSDFTYISNWDIDATFKEKAYKNGINDTSDGMELCFGMSQYGTHTYILTYDVSNMIYNLEDSQMLYWKFINDSMNPYPKKFSVKVSGPEKYSDNLDVWGYGYEGYAYVYDGIIEMSNIETRDFKSSEYAVLLVKYPLNTFVTDNKIETYDTFDDAYEAAKEGSFSYREPSLWEKIWTVLCSLFFVFIIAGSVVVAYIFSKEGTYVNVNIDKNDINPFRDIPCDKNILNAYYLSKVYGIIRKKEDLFGAIILKWVLEGQIKIIEKEKDSVFGSKNVTSLDVTKDLDDNTPLGKLYGYLKEASRDGILESKELEKWSGVHYNTLYNWFNTVDNYVKRDFENKRYITKVKAGKLIKYSAYQIEPKLEEEAKHLIGLKKFLKEVSSIHEKRPIEVKLWEYYLIYAQIFGMAKEVADSFKKLYPDVVRNMEEIGFNYNTFMIINSLQNNTVKAMSVAKARAESYSSGGGGHSFGGGGGGSFGGGSGGGAR